MTRYLGVFFLFCSLCTAQEEPYYFYHGRDFGSEAVINPLAFIVNGGFGILQYPDRSRKIFDIPYASAFRNVVDNSFVHPFYSIKRYGWKDFINNELIPGSLNRKNAQYWPNYQNHLIGGGMDYVIMCEWYRFHGVEHPRIFGAATYVVYHLLNETVENGSYQGITVDPVADLLVFDPLSVVLFSLNGVPEFFSKTLNMAEWPTQPDYNPFTKTIENHGVNYSLKYKLPFAERVSFFYYWGLTGLVGLSVHTDGGLNFSGGAGLRAKQLVEEGDPSVARKQTAELTWNTGVFCDKDNSLLASLLVSGISDYSVHANLYPGPLTLFGVSPGLFAAWGHEGKFVAGINLSYFPFGLAAGVSE